MADKPTCFMAMPISTHDPAQYGGDEKHFHHVMEHLFEPAIDKAGFKPIRPVAKGSDLIHAGIIKNLIESDLVLLDSSSLNPNVFFEFGIRTALDKPMCLIKDELVTRIPFDTGSLNHYTYQSKMLHWDMKAQIEALAAHIEESKKPPQSLWHFFGVTIRAAEEPSVSESSTDAKLKLIMGKLTEMDQRIPPDWLQSLQELERTKLMDFERLKAEAEIKVMEHAKQMEMMTLERARQLDRNLISHELLDLIIECNPTKKFSVSNTANGFVVTLTETLDDEQVRTLSDRLGKLAWDRGVEIDLKMARDGSIVQFMPEPKKGRFRSIPHH